MKYIHVYGIDGDGEAGELYGTYIEFKRITKFAVKPTKCQLIDKTKIRVELICDVVGGDRYVLAPYAICNSNDEVESLRCIIPYIIQTLTSHPEGTIIRCFNNGSEEWDVVNETKEGF